MTTYTMETLKEDNLPYHREYGIAQSDVEKVNQWIEMIGNTRNEHVPQIGDMVQFTDKCGNYYPYAHIEDIEDESITIYEHVNAPFVGKTEKGFYTSASGGSENFIPKKLKYVGQTSKLFKDWGYGGPRGNGAVLFYAMVNVWEYMENEELEYTTKTHDKFHLMIREVIDSTSYRYIIQQNSCNYTAFRTEEEYHAWLKTFKGVEKEGYSSNERVIWTYKQKNQYVPLETYLNIHNAIVDTTLCNGTIQECKRVYEGTMVTTYLPHQNQMIDLEGKRPYQHAYQNG